ncbi:MAG: hypothetical protein ACK57N_12770 [Planctomycetia bacterium]
MQARAREWVCSTSIAGVMSGWTRTKKTQVLLPAPALRLALAATLAAPGAAPRNGVVHGQPW